MRHPLIGVCRPYGGVRPPTGECLHRRHTNAWRGCAEHEVHVGPKLVGQGKRRTRELLCATLSYLNVGVGSSFKLTLGEFLVVASLVNTSDDESEGMKEIVWSFGTTLPFGLPGLSEPKSVTCVSISTTPKRCEV